ARKSIVRAPKKNLKNMDSAGVVRRQRSGSTWSGLLHGLFREKTGLKCSLNALSRQNRRKGNTTKFKKLLSGCWWKTLACQELPLIGRPLEIRLRHQAGEKAKKANLFSSFFFFYPVEPHEGWLKPQEC